VPICSLGLGWTRRAFSKKGHARILRIVARPAPALFQKEREAGADQLACGAAAFQILLQLVPAEGGPDLALHRKGAAASDRGLVPVPGSRGTLSYLVEPLAAARAETLASLAHGAGRKYDRASMHGRVRAKKSDVARLERNPFGGVVVCEDRDLLVEEAPEAYKNIDHVITDLVEFGLARVVATFRPLVTFKKAQGRTPATKVKRGKSWKEDWR